MNFEKSLKLIMNSALDAAKPRGKFINLPQNQEVDQIIVDQGLEQEVAYLKRQLKRRLVNLKKKTNH